MEPPPKKVKQDGNLALVDRSILLAARDPERWVEERRKNWPSKARVAAKLAEAEASAKDAAGASTSRASDQGKSEAKGDKDTRPICRFFLRGKCQAGDRCRFRHERRPPSEHVRTDRVYKRFEAPPQSSLFVKLVQTDQQVEDETFLEFIQYLAKHNRI